MPTVNTSTSRSFRITREYATKNGQEPLRPRELEQIAPKASKKHRAEVQQAGADASAWVPCKAVATALVTAGRSTITKPVRRVAASLATSTAGLPPTLRVIFSEDMDQSALAFAIGAAEAVEAKSRVLVVVASSQAALVEGTMDKVRALFPAAAASVVTLVDKAAAEKVALSAIKSANVVLSTVEAITALFDRKAVNGKHIFREHVSSQEGAFSVTAVLEASADVDAALRTFTVSLVPTTTRRLVIIAPSTRAAAAVPTAVAPNGGAAPRNVVTINMFTVEGVQKFNLLHQLVANSGRTERVLVHFATKEIASFYCEALYALNVDATILCDVPQDEGVDEDEEGTPGTSTAITVPSVADVVAAKGLPPSHYLDGVLRRFEAAAQEGKGCVLLSGFGLQSQHATVVLEFDVPTNLQDSVDACIVAPVSRRTIAMFDPHCAPGAIAIMKHHGKARGVNVRFEQLPMPASKSVALNSMKLKSLTKKIFTLANKGFAAYRSYMHYYSLLRPTDTFNVRKLDLERCAEQYGLEEAPLLDLRTKANEFRPKEDWVKAAQRRLRLDRRETRQRMQEMFGHIGNEEEAEEEPVEAA